MSIGLGLPSHAWRVGAYQKDHTLERLIMSVPIIPWLGGKRRLADRLLPLFPPHECYVEVFCGGAALFFLRQIPAQTEVINDINGELVNLYRVVQNHLEEFVRQFKWAISSLQIFKWHQDTKPETLTDIQRAARFYYLQHHAFGGKVDGQNFGTATTTPMIDFCRIGESLTAAHLRMAGTNVENLPWQECLRRYDRAHTFFYMDPPYWKTEGYGVPFEWDQYVEMASMVRNLKGRAMISINDHSEIREAFAGLTMFDLGIKYSIGNNQAIPGESKELVITNWEAGDLGGLF